MKKLGNLKVSNKMYKMVTELLRVNNDSESGPYEFVCTDGYGKMNKLYHKAIEVGEWAEKNGAEVILKERNYGSGYILVITDPVASNIEMELKYPQEINK